MIDSIVEKLEIRQADTPSIHIESIDTGIPELNMAIGQSTGRIDFFHDDKHQEDSIGWHNIYDTLLLGISDGAGSRPNAHLASQVGVLEALDELYKGVSANWSLIRANSVISTIPGHPLSTISALKFTPTYEDEMALVFGDKSRILKYKLDFTTIGDQRVLVVKPHQRTFEEYTPDHGTTRYMANQISQLYQGKQIGDIQAFQPIQNRETHPFNNEKLTDGLLPFQEWQSGDVYFRFRRLCYELSRELRQESSSGFTLNDYLTQMVSDGYWMSGDAIVGFVEYLSPLLLSNSDCDERQTFLNIIKNPELLTLIVEMFNISREGSGCCSEFLGVEHLDVNALLNGKFSSSTELNNGDWVISMTDGLQEIVSEVISNIIIDCPEITPEELVKKITDLQMSLGIPHQDNISIAAVKIQLNL